MELYTLLRAFADSWALLALFLIFVGVVIYVFRPGGSAKQRDAANSIFRNENRPATKAEPVDREAK